MGITFCEIISLHICIILETICDAQASLLDQRAPPPPPSPTKKIVKDFRIELTKSQISYPPTPENENCQGL